MMIPLVINRPTNEELLIKLRRKLDEYKLRLETPTGVGTVCKLELLSRVLESGQVNVLQAEQELRERLGERFNSRRFENAVVVIHDYCTTGGANVYNGGLGALDQA